MGTKIEWAEESWNPVTGCTPVSESCENCYAERMAKRLAGRFGYPADEPFGVTLHPERLEQPLKWRKPRRIFTCSMGDLFHPDVPFDFTDEVFDIMSEAKTEHAYLILTKRPERMKEYFEKCRQYIVGVPDLWLGVTAENQARADERIPVLLEIPWGIKFVSIEPMLGPVDLRNIPVGSIKGNPSVLDALTGMSCCPATVLTAPTNEGEGGLNWVILGGETGPGARPVHPDWVRDVCDQCQAAGVPFFFKQWGEWWPYSQMPGTPSLEKEELARKHAEILLDIPDANGNTTLASVFRVGKKGAGRELDGREWNEYPK